MLIGVAGFVGDLKAATPWVAVYDMLHIVASGSGFPNMVNIVGVVADVTDGRIRLVSYPVPRRAHIVTRDAYDSGLGGDITPRTSTSFVLHFGNGLPRCGRSRVASSLPRRGRTSARRSGPACKGSPRRASSHLIKFDRI